MSFYLDTVFHFNNFLQKATQAVQKVRSYSRSTKKRKRKRRKKKRRRRKKRKSTRKQKQKIPQLMMRRKSQVKKLGVKKGVMLVILMASTKTAMERIPRKWIRKK
jgi:hypothetical protein